MAAKKTETDTEPKKKPAAAKPAAKKKATAKKAPTRGKRKAAPSASAGLSASEVNDAAPPPDVVALQQAIADDGGAALAAYRDPLEGRWVVMAALPLEKVTRTDFQRDVSEPHVDRLADAIRRTGSYLDPIICVRSGEGYHSPNGGHRLAALTRMGAKTVTALVILDDKVAYKILALNVEKAHSLKERALEVHRMATSLAALGGKESAYAAEFEDPALLTLGACYEEKARFAGSAYHPVLKRCESFLEQELAQSTVERTRRAAKLLAVEEQVTGVIQALKKKGFNSPYLRNFVVARINPLRFSKSKDKADFDETVDKMLDKATNFDAEKVKEADVSKTSGGGSD